MSKQSTKDAGKSLAGHIDENVYWEFKNAQVNSRMQVKEAVELAAKLFINTYNKSVGEGPSYDISAKFGNASNEAQQA